LQHEIVLPGVVTEYTDQVPVPTHPGLVSAGWQANQNEYALNVEGLGSFYVSGGNKVEYSAEADAEPDWVNLYLQGQVLVALLHQRKIISFHASSFIFSGLSELTRHLFLHGETHPARCTAILTFSITID